jgi:hypothetical protein
MGSYWACGDPQGVIGCCVRTTCSRQFVQPRKVAGTGRKKPGALAVALSTCMHSALFTDNPLLTALHGPEGPLARFVARMLTVGHTAPRAAIWTMHHLCALLLGRPSLVHGYLPVVRLALLARDGAGPSTLHLKGRVLRCGPCDAPDAIPSRTQPLAIDPVWLRAGWSHMLARHHGLHPKE